ncbi:molybdopterin-dependent oxidoreductase [Agromyces sp. CFH 90414]|uniref:Molybdopterin-dependent oxidoreductase n=1 Tax=Agromyces agglutinans TaxID=2662258 RepID=A0A6I2F4B5_9MICO|nr:molybdopterin-dependent oxidoreductase [Agromyces agglutinans]MRG59429.1 molybdopterin-dependent oxidoreductase [Agromyces agglutinans]
MRATDARTPGWRLPALAGLAAAAVAAGVGELVAAIAAPESGPFVVVGAAVIDLAPPWAKDAAIALFGTADKLALIVGIVLVLAAVAGGAGVLESRRSRLGAGVFLMLGVLGAIAAATRAGSGTLAILPSAAAGIAGAVAVMHLVRRVPGGEAPAAPEASRTLGAAGASGASAAPEASVSPAASAPDRRSFLAWAGGAAAVGVLAALAGNALQAGRRMTQAVRDAVTLPRATASATIPASAELHVDGITPLVTPNADFYRIDTALRVPEIDPAEWSLRIHGRVAREVVLTWSDLLALPMAESVTTLACVSNEVGGGLIGNAVWLGHPIRDLLARAEPDSDADMVLSRSVDGFTASTPLAVLQDDRDAVLAIGMNGEPLPLEHGFPVRMVVPGLYGYVSATKWVTELEVTRFDEASAYWTDRGWSERGPIKISSRIDVPRPGQRPAAGTVVVAGVAWHQHVGIEAVEVQVDDGPWREAELATAISADTWVQWRYEWADAAAGGHTLRVRAIGADGEVQTAREQGVVPDGATGLHTVTVDVG